MNKLVFVFILLFLSSNIFASGRYVGAIEEVWANGEAVEGIGWISTVGTITTGACTSTEWFAIDLSKAESDLIMSIALAAKMANKEVRIGGTGICRGNYEYLQFIAVK